MVSEGKDTGDNVRKTTIAMLLAFTISGTSLADASMVGNWRCAVVAEYGEFESILVLNDDSSYMSKQNLFGEISVGAGSWALEGTELVMKREKYTKNGEERISSQEFRRNIVSVSDTTMKMKHGETATTCTRL